MLRIKRPVTVCVDKEYCTPIHKIINNHITKSGTHVIHVEDDKTYIGFDTYLTVEDVAKILKERLHGPQIRIVGGTILVHIELYL